MLYDEIFERTRVARKTMKTFTKRKIKNILKKKTPKNIAIVFFYLSLFFFFLRTMQLHDVLQFFFPFLLLSFRFVFLRLFDAVLDALFLRQQSIIIIVIVIFSLIFSCCDLFIDRSIDR